MERPVRVVAIIESATNDPSRRTAWRRMWRTLAEGALPYVQEYLAEQEASEAA
jgi:hypothetical protein